MKVYFPFKFVSFLICSFKLFLGIFTSLIAMSSWRVCSFIIMKSSLSLLMLFILSLLYLTVRAIPILLCCLQDIYDPIPLHPFAHLHYCISRTLLTESVQLSLTFLFILKNPWTLLDFSVSLHDCSYWRVWFCPSICCLCHLIFPLSFAFHVLFWANNI